MGLDFASDDLLKQGIAILLSANQLIAYWLAGNKNNLGWLLGVAGGLPWIVFIVVWEVWGLAPLVIGLQIIYVRNLVRWWKESRDVPVLRTAAEPPQLAHSHAQRPQPN